MAEIKSGGYQTLRDFANSSAETPNSWDYIEVYDDTGSVVTRVSITDDSRCQWLSTDGDAVLEVEFVLTGSDSDVSTPVTIVESALWNASSGGTQITERESFAEATLVQSEDTVTGTHTVNIPQQ